MLTGMKEIQRETPKTKEIQQERPIIAKPKKNKNWGIRASSLSMTPPSCGKWTKGILDKDKFRFC
jgi:hypothetical protein